MKAMPHTSRTLLTIVLAFGLVVSALYGSTAHASATTVPSARSGGPFSSHGTSLSGPFTGQGSSQHPPQGSLVHQPLEPNQAAYLQAKARLNAHVPRGSVSQQGLSQRAVPTVPVSFKGLGQNGGAPSDSTGAVGTKRYIELVNSQYGIYSRTGSPIMTGPSSALAGDPQSGNCETLSDPQVIWDTATNRFYYVILDTAKNLLCIGFSKSDSPSSGVNDFCRYAANYGYGSNLPDYPKLGDFNGYLLIGVNVFAGNNYQGSDLDSITKPAGKGAISTCPASSTFGLSRFSQLKNADNSDAWTPIPAYEVDVLKTGWVVATQDVSGGGSSSYITVFAVTNNNGSLILGSAQTVSINTYAMPPDAPQKGTTNLLDTMDGRLTNAVASIDPANGNQMAIWTQHTIDEDFGSAVVWYEINPSASTLFQQGEIIPPGYALVYIFNAAISSDRKVNSSGASFGADMAIGFNTSSSSTFVTDDVITQVASTPHSPPSQFKQVASSSAAFQQAFACSTNSPDDCRWGDYSGASPDPSGNRGAVWFTNAQVDSTGNWATHNWEAIAGNITEYPIPTSGSAPDGITDGPDGNLWFTENNSDQIGKITPAGAITEYPLSSTGNFPTSITDGPDGNLWFTEQNGNKIGKITTAGAITEFTLPTGSAPDGITAGPDGNLWFTENSGDKIGKITPAGAITAFTLSSGSGPFGITAGSDGNLWFTEKFGNKIGKITPAGAITEYPILTSSNSFPFGITAGPDGNLWFTENNGDKIGKITTAGTITEYTLPSAGFPFGITAGPDGNLWFLVSRSTGHTIDKITPTGIFTEYLIPTTGNTLSFGITDGSDGNLWFTENQNNMIGKITP